DPLAQRIGLVRTMVFTHLPSNVLLIAIALMPSFEGAALMLLLRFAISNLDQPTRQALVMRVVPAHDRARAAGLTTAVRPAAAAFGPLVSGFSMAGAAFGAPFFIAGGIKIVYDLAVFAQFHDLETTVSVKA
ncbi:MAG: MFS transporter, partial [Candidatus Eremiobacteraeota bacterium]|nr:MFS transporter [Candidatus Eremiobacteraeota bacterium]MBV8356167.1 MFS transporter [Candidatus Eremiobacteraeota bacterium]